MEATELIFYKQPFRKSEHVCWVYDANGNFVFQFETKFNDKGNYADGELELQKKVVDAINAEEHSPIENINLSVDANGRIVSNGRILITIRGWGNLTGVGAHNFTPEKAAKIQDDFSSWLVKKLSADTLLSQSNK